MNKTIRLILIGILLISCFLMGTATAEQEDVVEVELLTYITPQDIRENDFDVCVSISATNIPQEYHPVTIKYLFNGEEIFTSRENYSGGGFAYNRWFNIDKKFDGLSGYTEMQVIASNGSLIYSEQKYQRIYLFDPQKKTAELQLISVEISKNDQGLFGIFKEDLYQAKFFIKNMNSSLAFKGKITFGDFRPIENNWQVSKKDVVLGPREYLVISRTNMTEEMLLNIKTDLSYCSSC